MSKLHIDENYCLENEALTGLCPKCGKVKCVQRVTKGCKDVMNNEYCVLNHYCKLCGKHLHSQKYPVAKVAPKQKRWI
jgi:hypothetical protein